MILNKHLEFLTIYCIEKVYISASLTLLKQSCLFLEEEIYHLFVLKTFFGAKRIPVTKEHF